MFIVKYTGPFGFIKPWTAVRDSETYSQNFLTPSIIMGIEMKLFPELLDCVKYEQRILRHRLTYSGISRQQEQTQPREYKQTVKKKEKCILFERPKSILIRGVLINPVLLLGFKKNEYAAEAVKQHICLCRNEDLLLPNEFENIGLIKEVSEEDFDSPGKGYNGFELRFGQNSQSFLVGYNRFMDNTPMYGRLNIVGSNPMKSEA